MTTHKIVIRKFEPADGAAVKELIGRVLTEEFPDEAEAFTSVDLDDIESAYGKLGETFFVACVNGRVVGTVGIKQEDSRTALLRRLFVDSGFRGRRLGDLLADRAIEFCREVGYEELIFKTTSTMKNAIELGKRKGFVPRARLSLGSVELVKFVLFLKKELVANHSAIHKE